MSRTCTIQPDDWYDYDAEQEFIDKAQAEFIAENDWEIHKRARDLQWTAKQSGVYLI